MTHFQHGQRNPILATMKPVPFAPAQTQKKMRKSPNRENGDFLQVMLVAALKKNADALFPV
jgi:hypothetical protein